MRVLHPGIGTAALTDDSANVRAGNDVGPGRWRGLPGFERDDVFVAIGREATKAIVENELARLERINSFSARLLRRRQQIGWASWRHATIHLLDQGSRRCH